MRVLLSLAVVASSAVACTPGVTTDDAKCPTGEFCRAVCQDSTNIAGAVEAQEFECVAAQNAGDYCGGYTMECKQQQCADGLTCDYSQNDPGISDQAGRCTECVMCTMAVPTCESSCSDCEIVPSSCTSCSRAVCMDEPVTVACEDDAECGDGEFCRAACDTTTSSTVSGTNAVKKMECVAAQGKDQSCGGFNLECKEERCAVGLTCDHSGNDARIADQPGTCQDCVICPQTLVALSCEDSCSSCEVSPQTCTKCSEAVCQDVTDECNTMCAEIYRPVCASNGETYSNECEFLAARCLAKAKDWTIEACVAEVCKENNCPDETPICTPVQCITTPCDEYTCSAEETPSTGEEDACDGVNSCCPEGSSCMMPRGGSSKQCVGATDGILSVVDCAEPDCRTKEVWTDAKSEWCCANKKVGCDESEPTAGEGSPTAGETPTTEAEHNCQSKEMWSIDKTVWCCLNEQLGCEDREESGAQAASASFVAVCLALVFA